VSPRIRKIFILVGVLLAVIVVCGCTATGSAISLSRAESGDSSDEPVMSSSNGPSVSVSAQAVSPLPSPSLSPSVPPEPSISAEPVVPADNFIFPAECWETARFVDGATSIIIEMEVAAGTPIFSPYVGEASKIYWGNEDDGVYEMSIEFTSENNTSITVTAAVIRTISALTDEREGSDICPELNTSLKTMGVLAGEEVGTVESGETLGFCTFGNVALELPPEEEIPEGMSPLEFVKLLLSGPSDPS